MCKGKYKVPHIVKQRRWEARFRDFQERTPSPSDSNAGAVEGGHPSRSRSRTRSQQVMGRSTRSGSPSPVERRSKSRNTSRSWSRSRSRSENRHHPQQDIGGATPGGKQKGPRKITWCDVVTGTKADSAQSHPLSGRPRVAADPGLAARMENMEKENRELRQELAKARKQNEKSTRKIEELQQTLNEILKRMGGHPAETPSSGASLSHGAADEHDTTSAVGGGDTDMGCGGEYEAPVVVGLKRKSPSDSQHFEGAENHTQEPKRARPAGRKIDVIEEMVDKLTNKREGLFETLLIRLNESDAERNAQYAVVNNLLAAVKKPHRIFGTRDGAVAATGTRPRQTGRGRIDHSLQKQQCQHHPH
nr:serine/arginine-rich splicing factor 4-like [Rhipicephalus microplus]